MTIQDKLDQYSDEAAQKGFDKPPKKKKEDTLDTLDSKKPVSSKEEGTTTQKLMAIIDIIHFFSDTAGTPWAKVDESCYPVQSTGFKRRLQRLYYQRHSKTPHSQALQDVLDQSTGIALFDSAVEDIHVRVAKKGEYIVVDRYDGVITIAPHGWEQGRAIDANFWQPQGLNSLPLPDKRGDGINLLRKYLNFDAEDDFRLLVAWLLAAYNPEIPCPILVLQGEQGSAKSTNSKVLRSLIDPSGAMINPAPREERSLVIQAQNSHVLCLDNLSGLKVWLSDALCRICSGTGFSTRRLYTNDEQQIFQVQKPIILNGIDDIATRGDLLSRSIVLNLPAIPPEDRKDEREFWRVFKLDQPFILGSIYDAISAGLTAGKPQLQQLPRMADFAEWVTRCETGLKWNTGSILKAYSENKDNAIEAGLDGDYLGSAIRKIMNSRDHYEGTATDLCEKIRYAAPDVNEKYLPTTRTLKNRLTRLAPALRKVGIDWDYNPNGNQRTYSLDNVQKEVSKVSKVSANGQKADDMDALDSKNPALSKGEDFNEKFNEQFNSHEHAPF